jgi:hypothetical protein
MLALPRVPFKALYSLLQQFRCHGQVPLRARDMDMAEISCQLGQQALHVCPLAVPGNQAMNREGMPQVVKSRLIAASILAYDACADSQTAEDILSRVARDEGCPAGEE